MSNETVNPALVEYWATALEAVVFGNSHMRSEDARDVMNVVTEMQSYARIHRNLAASSLGGERIKANSKGVRQVGETATY